MIDDEPDVAVVGAGVIGASVAFSLQLAGQNAILVECGEPGHGCSYGNAGIIATSFVEPLASLANLAALPMMLLSPSSPVAVRYSNLLRLSPWLVSFFRHAAPSKFAESARALAEINHAAMPAWRKLQSLLPKRLLHEQGLLQVTAKRHGTQALHSSSRRIRELGVRVVPVPRGDVHNFEPALKSENIAGAMFHPDVAHVSDPYSLVQMLTTEFIRAGGRLVQARVLSLVPEASAVKLNTKAGTIRVPQVAIAAGYGSAELLRPLGVCVPIAVEMGYHVNVRQPEIDVRRPISFYSESFVATPMRGGLRLAGTVELAAEEAPPKWSRAYRLTRLVEPYLGELHGEALDRWCGGRPTLPDSLPALGTLSDLPRVHYAFGHQHLGLTLAAVTAECMRAFVLRQAAPIDVRPFSLTRFGAARSPTGLVA